MLKRETERESEWDWVCKWMSHQSVVCDSGAVKLTAPPLCQEKDNECDGKVENEITA